MPLLRASQIPTSQRGVGDAAPQPRAFGLRVVLAIFGVLLVLVAAGLSANEFMGAKAPLVNEAELLASGKGGAPDKQKLDQARAALARTVRHAPHDSRAWLQLAAVEMKAGAAPDTIAAALKMSYYTGSNEAELVAQRIGLAANPGLAGDTELKTLLETEILAVAQQPAVKPSLVQAYRQASPETQARLREIVAAIDASLATEMEGAVSKP